MESPTDRNKLTEPELFFDDHQDKCIILDEIQRMPELFPILRSSIDKKRTAGRFIILGSASPKIMKDSSEFVTFLRREFDTSFIEELHEYDASKFVSILNKFNDKIEFLDLIRWLIMKFGAEEFRPLIFEIQDSTSMFILAIIKKKVNIDLSELLKFIREKYGDASTEYMILEKSLSPMIFS